MIKVIRFIWQLPQNIIALIYYYYLLLSKQLIVPTLGKHDKVKIYTKKSPGCVTLGDYIFLSPMSSNHTLKHELGHAKQSLILGPLYLIIIGIPSIVWAMLHKVIAPNKSYYWFYTESIANKLGKTDVE